MGLIWFEHWSPLMAWFKDHFLIMVEYNLFIISQVVSDKQFDWLSTNSLNMTLGYLGCNLLTRLIVVCVILGFDSYSGATGTTPDDPD